MGEELEPEDEGSEVEVEEVEGTSEGGWEVCGGGDEVGAGGVEVGGRGEVLTGGGDEVGARGGDVRGGGAEGLTLVKDDWNEGSETVSSAAGRVGEARGGDHLTCDDSISTSADSAS